LYPLEYFWLNLRFPLWLLFIVGYNGVKWWTYKVAKEKQTASRTKAFVAVFILFLISAFLVLFEVFTPFVRLPWVIFMLIILSVLDVFPIYALFKRKVIRNRWFYLLLLLIGVISPILMWFLFG
jgi:hypothetical protein